MSENQNIDNNFKRPSRAAEMKRLIAEGKNPLYELGYMLLYPIPDEILDGVKQCAKIRNGDTGLSKQEAKEFIQKYFPIKVWAHLYSVLDDKDLTPMI